MLTVESTKANQTFFQICCPAPDCQVQVPVATMEKYLSQRKKAKKSSEKLVENDKSISKKCPGCVKVVSFVPDKSTTANDIKISHTVDCGNGHFFCWECGCIQGHAPVACTLWEKWHEKCAKMDTIGTFNDIKSRISYNLRIFLMYS